MQRALDHVYRQSKGRGQQSDLDRDYGDDSEPDQVDLIARQWRQEHRHPDEHDRYAIDQRAHRDDDQHVHDQ